MAEKKEIQAQIAEAVKKVKASCPLAPSTTNFVTINFVANAQLAVGGSAAMCYLPDETQAMARVGNSYYINVGTMIPIYEQSLPAAAKVLHELGKAWVLDPVATGIGELRTKVMTEFKKYKPSVIRGNASEIIAVAGLWELTDKSRASARGVDSTESVAAARQAAAAIADYTGGAVAVSGEVDLVTDGKITALSRGGSKFLPMITGAGCSLGGVTAVYAAVASPFIAALTATNVYNLAGERAEKKCLGPGTFQSAFLDELYRATAEEIAENPFEIEEE